MANTEAERRLVPTPKGEVEYWLVFSHRRKSRMKLNVESATLKVVVTAPIGELKSSADAFVAGNTDFIAKARAQCREYLCVRAKHYAPEAEDPVILYRGKVSPIEFDAAVSDVVPDGKDGWRICLAHPGRPTRDVMEAMLTELFRRKAKEYFEGCLKDYADSGAEMPVSWQLSTAKGRWGSCTAKRTIRLNWRLIFMPDGVSSYVVAHELAHLKHMNHSPAFWAETSRLCPGAHGWEKLLKLYSPVLPIFC